MILTDERSIESMDVELAYSAGAMSRLLKSLMEGSRVVLGESCGVATVCVIIGGWQSILLSGKVKLTVTSILQKKQYKYTFKKEHKWLRDSHTKRTLKNMVIKNKSRND